MLIPIINTGCQLGPLLQLPKRLVPTYETLWPALLHSQLSQDDGPLSAARTPAATASGRTNRDGCLLSLLAKPVHQVYNSFLLRRGELCPSTLFCFCAVGSYRTTMADSWAVEGVLSF